MATTRNRAIAVMLTAVVGLFTSGRAWAGTTNEPASPTNPASAMWTLETIYNVLDTRTTNDVKHTRFAEPVNGPTNGTMHTLNDIMTLVTNRAPVARTGQKVSKTPYDDGWYSTNIGVAWPNPRFTIGTNTAGPNDTNCVTDNLTGLMWTRNANLASGTFWSVNGTCSWATAFNVITNVNGANGGVGYGGYTDWRLPNVCELASLSCLGVAAPQIPNTAGTGQCMSTNDPFVNIQLTYWSSTSADVGEYSYLGLGGRPVISSAGGILNKFWVWPVRGGGQ